MCESNELDNCDGNAGIGLSLMLFPVKKRVLCEKMDEEERSNKKRKIIQDDQQHCDTNDHQRHDEAETTKSNTPFKFELLPTNKSPHPPQLLNLIDTLMLPWKLKSKIDQMGGFEIRMVIQKQLFKSDLSSNHNRFSIPENKISKEAMEFLREEEAGLLEARGANSKLAGIHVKVLDPCLREFDLFLKKWKMTRCSIYNLTHQWNTIVQQNHLQFNDTVQLWSFRISDNKLCFALVKL